MCATSKADYLPGGACLFAARMLSPLEKSTHTAGRRGRQRAGARLVRVHDDALPLCCRPSLWAPRCPLQPAAAPAQPRVNLCITRWCGARPRSDGGAPGDRRGGARQPGGVPGRRLRKLPARLLPAAAAPAADQPAGGRRHAGAAPARGRTRGLQPVRRGRLLFTVAAAGRAAASAAWRQRRAVSLPV